MSSRFVMFTNAHDRKPVLVNPDHVRTAYESGQKKVTLVIDRWQGSSFTQDVEGDLKSVWEMLTGEK
jgi:hypothetical protein